MDGRKARVEREGDGERQRGRERERHTQRETKTKRDKERNIFFFVFSLHTYGACDRIGCSGRNVLRLRVGKDAVTIDVSEGKIEDVAVHE